jgi:hypothetical protein
LSWGESKTYCLDEKVNPIIYKYRQSLEKLDSKFCYLKTEKKNIIKSDLRERAAREEIKGEEEHEFTTNHK